MKRLILFALCLALLSLPCFAQEEAEAAPEESTPALEKTASTQPTGSESAKLYPTAGRFTK